MTTHALSWLTGQEFVSLKRMEYDWDFKFGSNTSVLVSCLWRVLESGSIRLTSDDDAQWFGHPEPIDAEAKLNSMIVGMHVVGVELRDGTLDMDVRFENGTVLQFIPISSGYEAWLATGPLTEAIAIGGGMLTVRPRTIRGS